MVTRTLVLNANAVVVCLGLFVLLLLVRARELKTYWPMVAMAMWEAPPYLMLQYLRHYGPGRISAMDAYNLYFYTFWSAFAAQSLCAMLLTYTIFRAAMRPLKGLQSLGNIMFVWAASISLATAISVAVNPAGNGSDMITLALSQLQRSSAILIISLMLFVALSIRPMGLSLRSRVFGATVGTMIVSATNVLEANYHFRVHSMYDIPVLVRLVSSCVALCIWAFYFGFPEPKRRFILLPTTSPFHQWNKAAHILGEDPGVVAIGGIAPDAIAKSELEVFRRASVKIREVDERQARATLSTGAPDPS